MHFREAQDTRERTEVRPLCIGKEGAEWVMETTWIFPDFLLCTWMYVAVSKRLHRVDSNRYASKALCGAVFDASRADVAFL
jgi:hypothetical protein